MSQNIFAIAGASLISMMAGVALTLVFTAEALDTVPADGSDALMEVATQLKRTDVRLDRMERGIDRALSSTRRDVRQVLDARALGGAGGGGGAGGAVFGAAHVSRDTPGEVSSKNLAALAPLKNWGNDEKLRTKWLFATERAALTAFGPPDEISVRGSAESWTYWKDVSGDRIASEYRLKFNNGRLVEGQFLEFGKPRTKPLVAR